MRNQKFQNIKNKEKLVEENINLNKINIKGTTTEKLGFLGKRRYCVPNVTVSMKNDLISNLLCKALGLVKFHSFWHSHLSILPLVWFLKQHYGIIYFSIFLFSIF